MRTGERIEHTDQVAAAAEAVRSSARTVESHAHGYRLSGKAPMLAEYLAEVPRGQAVAELVALSGDIPAQQRRARLLARRWTPGSPPPGPGRTAGARRHRRPVGPAGQPQRWRQQTIPLRRAEEIHAAAARATHPGTIVVHVETTG